jgi:hypothetical protein
MPQVKKQKVPSPKTLRNKLWSLCSSYIRQRDKGVCFTCERSGFEGSGYHAGHFIPKSTCGINLRYDERNIHGQCYHCNINLGGFGAAYQKNMVKRYGKSFVDKLWHQYHSSHGQKGWSTQQYMDKIAYYEDKLKSSRFKVLKPKVVQVVEEAAYTDIDD